jgi:hypothetical protein
MKMLRASFLARAKRDAIPSLKAVRLAAMSVCFLGAAGLSQAQTAPVTVAWTASTDPAVVGYKVSYGGRSGVYTNSIVAGNVTKATIPGLKVGATYFFAATSYDSSQTNESIFSNEITYTVPASNPPPSGARLQLVVTPARQSVIIGAGLGGATYEIQSSPDLRMWTVIGTSIADVNGAFRFTNGTASAASRSFRVRQISTSPAPVALSTTVIPGNPVQITGTGLPNHDYELQAAADLLTWMIVGTVHSDATGRFQFIDPGSMSNPSRLYRAME